jgi:copper homeostasis protein
MQHSIILEICLDSVESCTAAERGGARRGELCADLADDGTTPSAGLIAAARENIRISLQVMIRPRGGGFCYSDEEFKIMKRDISFAQQLGADGVVLGLLTRDGNIDVARTRELSSVARPMEVTFHRAFDVAGDPFRAFEDLIAAGVDRLLTSGQAPSALEGAELIRRLVQKSNGRIQIMAGVGVTVENAKEIRDRTGVRDIHVGSGASERVSQSRSGALSPAGSYRIVNSDKVARIVRAVVDSNK